MGIVANGNVKALSTIPSFSMIKTEYIDNEIVELLKKAKKLGLYLGPGSDLEQLTLEQLRVLVEYKQ